jgi:DNA-binding NarL/FixJ family response regulator
MDKTKVVIADDHPILRDGLRKLLEAEQDFAVVGEAYDGHGAVEVTRRVEPNILLLDLAMPGLPGLEVLRALNGVPLATRTILLTANIERDEVVKALQLGARGYVMKDSASELLMKAMRMVMAGQYWIGRESVSGLVETLRTQMFASSEPKFGLTPRELEIVKLIAEAHKSAQIAEVLQISVKTVERHRQNILEKLGMSDRVELTRYAIRRGLIQP